MHSSGTVCWSCPILSRVGANPWALVLPAPGKQIFLQFSLWTVTLLIFPENRGGGRSLRGSRSFLQFQFASCWGAPGEEVRRGAKPAPVNQEMGASHTELWLIPKPSSVRCSAPPPAMASEHLSSAGLHGSLGIIEWVLWHAFSFCIEFVDRHVCYLSSGLVSESVWVTSFAS